MMLSQRRKNLGLSDELILEASAKFVMDQEASAASLVTVVPVAAASMVNAAVVELIATAHLAQGAGCSQASWTLEDLCLMVDSQMGVCQMVDSKMGELEMVALLIQDSQMGDTLMEDSSMVGTLMDDTLMEESLMDGTLMAPSWMEDTRIEESEMVSTSEMAGMLKTDSIPIRLFIQKKDTSPRMMAVDQEQICPSSP